MQYGVVVEELAVEVMAQLPNDRARQEVTALAEIARTEPRAWPDARDPGSVKETREEAFGRRCWIPYMPHTGAMKVHDIGSDRRADLFSPRPGKGPGMTTMDQVRAPLEELRGELEMQT
ncbi:hypothetical protein [Streptomyces curacoi]|uniref:hypothetical protein n=1 Tax=Streptomyces curacoi TaxID=146536 RepID=UPI000AB03E8E